MLKPMFANITTANGGQKPTPRIVLALLVALLTAVWGAKEDIVAMLHLSPALSTLVAAILTPLLVFLADQYGVNLPTPPERKEETIKEVSGHDSAQ